MNKIQEEKVHLNDRVARLVGIPIIVLIMNILMKSEANHSNLNVFVSYFISLVFTFVYWEGNRQIWRRLIDKYPHYHQTQKRLILLVLYCILFTFFSTVALEKIAYWLTLEVCFQNKILKGFFQALIPLSICMLAYESVYFFESWKENIKKAESLARENIQSQLDSLKNQLDPHFLFNSMNTLASLIDEKNINAQKYLEMLSDVYRYVLMSKEKNTVSLEEEMAFLDAYVYLNKVRYRDNLIIEKDISTSAFKWLVAPLSLQMLVENAIKHNVVSKERPLTIKITNDSDYISIENNIQEKKIFEKSTKVGLLNIINRYNLLSDKKVEIINTIKHFKVKIPLLHN